MILLYWLRGIFNSRGQTLDLSTATVFKATKRARAFYATERQPREALERPNRFLAYKRNSIFKSNE